MGYAQHTLLFILKNSLGLMLIYQDIKLYNMKKAVLILLLFLIAVPYSAFADGGIWHYYQDRWEPLTENEQKVAINYQDGLEKMIIDVNFQMGSDNKAVWIFPVPAKPQKVVIDVLSAFPQLYGTSPVQEAKSSVGSILLIGTVTQIYPIFLAIPFIFFGGFFSTMAGSAMTNMASSRTGVTVYEHIEKEGIATEIITAEDGNALYNYIVNKGLNIQRDAISIFDGYIGKNYSFVVSWVIQTLLHQVGQLLNVLRRKFVVTLQRPVIIIGSTIAILCLMQHTAQ